MNKPIYAKPSYFAIIFEQLKHIALEYGYNCVLHGSLNRDLDLILIPWQSELGSLDELLNKFCAYVGGKLDPDCEKWSPHKRKHYVINIYRGGYLNDGGFGELIYTEDPQTYIDISVIMTQEK